MLRRPDWSVGSCGIAKSAGELPDSSSSKHSDTYAAPPCNMMTAMLEQATFTVEEEEEDVSRPPTQPPTRIIITLSSMAAAAAAILSFLPSPLPLGVPPMDGGA